MRAELNETLQALLHSHEMAYEWFGGLTETTLYDNPKTVCLKRDFEGKDKRESGIRNQIHQTEFLRSLRPSV